VDNRKKNRLPQQYQTGHNKSTIFQKSIKAQNTAAKAIKLLKNSVHIAEEKVAWTV